MQLYIKFLPCSAQSERDEKDLKLITFYRPVLQLCRLVALVLELLPQGDVPTGSLGIKPQPKLFRRVHWSLRVINSLDCRAGSFPLFYFKVYHPFSENCQHLVILSQVFEQISDEFKVLKATHEVMLRFKSGDHNSRPVGE